MSSRPAYAGHLTQTWSRDTHSTMEELWFQHRSFYGKKTTIYYSTPFLTGKKKSSSSVGLKNLDDKRSQKSASFCSAGHVTSQISTQLLVSKSPNPLPASVFTKELNGLTAFFTSQSPLSNHYACTFYEDGVFFKSSEQCFMYKKALLFKDETTAQQILEADRPEIAKVLGKHIDGYNSHTWKEASSEIMYRAMLAKFKDNPELRSFLLNTGQTTLVEANPTDSVWGVGLPLRNPDCFNPQKWKGKNLAGRALERVRQTLK